MTKLKKVKKKRSKYAILLDKAVEVFNRWIRERDKIRLGGKCYTCLVGEGSEAGHFRHNNNATKFSEVFVNLQCTRCNRWLSGNLGAYAIRLYKDYPKKIIDKLWKESFTTKTFTIGELEDIIQKYSPN